MKTPSQQDLLTVDPPEKAESIRALPVPLLRLEVQPLHQRTGQSLLVDGGGEEEDGGPGESLETGDPTGLPGEKVVLLDPPPPDTPEGP